MQISIKGFVKNLLIIFLSLTMLNVSAQKKITVDAGIDNSLPLGKFHDYYTYGIGIGADVNYKVISKASIYFSVAYMKYKLNVSYLDIKGAEAFAPMLLGGKVFLPENFYALAGGGINLDLGNVITVYSVYQVGLGRFFFKKIAAELKYERTGKYDFTPNVLKLRVAYIF